jgi:ABC-2 type transport system permease protein
MTTIASARPVAPLRAPRLTTTDQVRTAVALVSRDLAVLFMSPFQFLVRVSMQPALFSFVFAYVFPRIGFGIGGSRGGASSFGNVLLPGLMANTLMFQGIQSVALPLVQEFSFSKEIEDRVMAPVPTWAVAVSKIISGAIQSCFAAIIVVPAVWIASGMAISPDWGHPALLVSLVVLGSLVGAALGLLMGTIVRPQSINLLFALLILPLTLLGCVYYPWSALHTLRWLQIAVLFNPVVYMSEGLRASLAPQFGYISLWAVYGLLLAGMAVMTVAGVCLFRRRVIS